MKLHERKTAAYKTISLTPRIGGGYLPANDVASVRFQIFLRELFSASEIYEVRRSRLKEFRALAHALGWRLRIVAKADRS